MFRENHVGKFMKIHCTICPAGKRSFGKNSTIVETQFPNNIILPQLEEISFFLVLAPKHLLMQYRKIFFKNKYFCLDHLYFFIFFLFEREIQCVNHSYVQMYT